jgi:ferredoxin
MTKYKVIINRDRCVDCGISTGQCPTHAKTLSQLLSQNREGVSIGIFSEDIHDQVKQLAEACPAKAIIIEKIEQ